MLKRTYSSRTKTLSLIIILSLQINSVAYAATTIVPDAAQGKNPEVMRAANQTMVVNIRRPNSAGLSHNQYRDLQVGKDGAIFNNTSEIVKTQLAGYITGNKQLAGHLGANLILNEVTGNMPSSLNGYLEIAGQKASLVLANPNGIVGNNFGFINTSRAVLTTGIPQLDSSGQLNDFFVAQGEVRLEGAGLNARDTDYTDIYAKAVKLNAGLWAKNLSVITGKNKVAYATGKVQEVLDKQATGISLDVAALGGMYAHKIALVGTAQGLGVNTEGAITADQLSVDQEGHIINSGKMLSREELNLKTNAELSNQGELQSNGKVAIESSQKLTNTGSIYGAGAVALKAGDDIVNTGTVQSSNTLNLETGAAFTNSGKLKSNEDMNIKATKDFANTGNLQSNRALDINVTGNFANTGVLQSNKALDINVTGDITNIGNLQSNRALDINVTGDFTNTGEVQSVAELILNTRGNFNNQQGSMTGDGVLLTALGQIVNEGAVQSTKELRAEAGQELYNKNNMRSNGAMFLHSVQEFNNTGEIQSNNILDVTAEGELKNQGKLQSNETMHLKATKNFINNGNLQSNAALNIHSDHTFDNTGKIGSGARLSVNTLHFINDENGQLVGEGLQVKVGREVKNKGKLTSVKDIYLSGTSITNEGDILGKEDVNLIGTTDFANLKTIESGKELNVTSQGKLQNIGLLHGEKTTTVRGQAFLNSGTAESKGKLQLVFGQDIQNSGNLYSGTTMNLACDADLINLGQINSSGTITINSQKAVYNKKQISGTTGVTITSTQDLVNEDVMQSQGVLSLSSEANLRNEKLINGGKTVLVANGILHNAKGGRIYGDDLTLKAQIINNIAENKAPVIAARENLHLEANTINNHEHALLLSAGDMDIKVGTLHNKSASIEAGKNMHIQAGTIYNTNEHFATEVRTVQDEQLVEYQGSGSPHRYSAKGSNYTLDDKTIWPNGKRPDYDVYIFNDESLYLHTPEGDHEEWIKYEFRRVIKQPVITASDPGKITSGGNLTLTGDKVINDKSHIIAGGVLTAKVNELQNIEETGKQYVEDVGLVHNYWRHERRGRDDTGHKQAPYKPAVAITNIQVQAGSYLGNTAVTGSGVTAENKVIEDNGEKISDIDKIGNQEKEAISVVNQYQGTTINIKPSSLFDVVNNPTAAYYVETDPAFTNMQNWLSSDYFFKQINYDANKVAKRLGDGYYEQKMVRDQLMSLTGQRRVGDYASDEAQYKALLDNAVAFAKQSGAQVGVALTAEQQKELKEALVWMVEKSVVLPNGEVVKALVPQVYVPQEKTAYGIRSTAVLAGRSIDAAVANDILNNGTIVAAQGAAISAKNINNYGGKIQGSDVLLKAQKDLNNVGGTLLAENSLTAQAGRDINMATTSTTSADATGSKRTALNQVGGAYVTGDKGQMKLEAGRDLNLQAVEIVTEGKDSKAAMSAGRDVNLSTTEVGSANAIAWDDKNYRKDVSSQDVGTSIQAGGDLDIKAGRDVSATGAYVAAEQKLNVEAGNNINIEAGRHKEQVEEHHVHKGKSGGGNSLTKTTDERLDGNYALGSTVTGDKVSLHAGQDVNVTGSNVVGSNDVDIKAQGDVHITPAEESQKEKHFSKVEAKGIFGSGFGFVIGKQTTTEKQDVQSKMQAGSTVGSVTGNVNIAAGQNLQVEGSNIVAGKDINMSGAKVDIQAAEETYDSQYRYDYSLQGLTVSVGGGAVEKGQKVIGSLERAHQVKDKRLSALYGVKAIQDAANIGLKKNKEFSINVGIGSYKEAMNSDTTIKAAKESSIQAGGDVQIKATAQDINVVGSTVSGNNITLEAAENVNIQAAENSFTNTTDTSSTSVGAGITLSPNTPSGLYVSAGKSREDQSTTKTTHTPSTVTAQEKLTIKSGKDTNIVGSQVKGDRVEAQVGGNLNLESLQDTESYKEKSAQASVNIGVDTVTVGASAGKMTSDYSSVTSQAGIYAGKEGFDITVKGNIDLQGAVIDSKGEPIGDGSKLAHSKNKLTTGTITYSDIKNKAEYDAKGVGLSYDKKATQDKNEKLGNKGVIPAIPMGTGEKDSSTTRSAVAPGTIEIKDKDKQKQDIAGLSRDTDNTLNKLDPIFDKDKVRERQELAGLFSELAFKQIHDMKNCSNEQRAILHSAVGLVSAALAKSNLPANALAAGVNELVVQVLMNPKGKYYEHFKKHPEQLQWLSAFVGSVVSSAAGGNVGAGASTATSGTKNNYLNEEKMPMRAEIIGWDSVDEDGKAQMIHGAVRYVYDDGSSVEVHFGKYSGLQMPIGDGVILQANSDQYIQSEIDKGRARVITVISDANALKTMVNNTNSYMSELRNEYIGKDAIDKAKIRKDVYDRQKTDAILVYKGDAGTFSKYNAFLEPHCITFVTDVLKGTGHESGLDILELLKDKRSRRTEWLRKVNGGKIHG